MQQTVLLVEDDADLRDVLGDLLELEGYRVVPAANGKAALDLLQDIETPCVILLDLMMPVMDGYEFRTEQRRQPEIADIPVVVITAGTRVRAEIEPVMVFTKPLDMDKLLSAIEQYC